MSNLIDKRRTIEATVIGDIAEHVEKPGTKIYRTLTIKSKHKN